MCATETDHYLHIFQTLTTLLKHGRTEEALTLIDEQQVKLEAEFADYENFIEAQEVRAFFKTTIIQSGDTNARA